MLLIGRYYGDRCTMLMVWHGEAAVWNCYADSLGVGVCATQARWGASVRRTDHRLLPVLHSTLSVGADGLSIPLWSLGIAVTGPTAYLFHLDRRRFAPGLCQRCGYDMTDTTTGICPECGKGAAA